MMAISEIYSGATYFGVPLGPYFGAYTILMVLYLVPTLIAIGWALTVGQGRWPALRLVRPLGRGRYVPKTTKTAEEQRAQGSDRAA